MYLSPFKEGHVFEDTQDEESTHYIILGKTKPTNTTQILSYIYHVRVPTLGVRVMEN